MHSSGTKPAKNSDFESHNCASLYWLRRKVFVLHKKRMHTSSIGRLGSVLERYWPDKCTRCSHNDLDESNIMCDRVCRWLMIDVETAEPFSSELIERATQELELRFPILRDALSSQIMQKLSRSTQEIHPHQ